MKERRQTGGEWLIGGHTENISTLPFNCNNKTQDKTKARKTLIDEGISA